MSFIYLFFLVALQRFSKFLKLLNDLVTFSGVQVHIDPFEDEILAEKDAYHHQHSAGSKEVWLTPEWFDSTIGNATKMQFLSIIFLPTSIRIGVIFLSIRFCWRLSWEPLNRYGAGLNSEWSLYILLSWEECNSCTERVCFRKVPHCPDYLRWCLQEEEDVTKKTGGGKERHFSYYAYAGLSGIRRWTHRSEVKKILIFDLPCF